MKSTTLSQNNLIRIWQSRKPFIAVPRTMFFNMSITPELNTKKHHSSFNNNTNNGTINAVYNPNQVEKILGISHYSLYKLIRNNEIKSFKIGRCRRITSDAVAAFIAEREKDEVYYG